MADTRRGRHTRARHGTGALRYAARAARARKSVRAHDARHNPNLALDATTLVKNHLLVVPIKTLLLLRTLNLRWGLAARHAGRGGHSELACVLM